MTEESVRVAVRVRPFNQREKDRNAKLTINMNGAMTVISNPDDQKDQKKFTFDYSYWSHDDFTEDANGYLNPASPSSRYASQQKVFDDLGQGVLSNAIEGFNCSLFAYGQTGSGKSYSMVGYGNNKGIVPMTCNELFKIIGRNEDSNKRFVVTFSMLEIYNENVRDLLNKESPKGGLPVRENPSLGFYVQGLKKVPVGSYEEIEKRTEQGTANRTVAATNMNATSSRAHTVVTITFEQIIKSGEGENKKTSVMNLVDLAGSERADSTGATGDRLKEGANINKSLSALGNVISALADKSMGKKKVQIPYRDSVLTKLLKNALGGNSKTIMIAALSPADINYDETLGTLRYADRAKKIKNLATVNENPLDKLIRELREENEKLKAALTGDNLALGTADMSEAEIEKMKKQLEEEIRAQLMANADVMQMWESQEAQQEKIDAARAETVNEDNAKKVSDKKKKKVPHMMNLNEDPMLSGIVLHYLDGENTTIGRGDADPTPTIALKGLSISKNHAVLVKKGKNIEMRPGTQGAKTKVNGLPLTGPRDLQHKDRILFGSNHMYVFINPLNTECANNLPKEIDWEFAQSEIAEAKGYHTAGGANLSKEQQIAQEQILELLPMVTEVNAISEELDKHRTFEVVLISAAAQEGIYGTAKTTKVMVKMKNLSNDNTWLWERGKFMNRRYMIQEIYQRFLDGEDITKIKDDDDPFWEPPEDVLIGTSNVFLQSLGYCLDFDDKLQITDYKGLEEGQIYVTLLPCNQHGRPLPEEDSFIDEPSELLGKPYHFKVNIKRVEIIKSRFSRGLKVRYRVFKEENFVETETIRGTLEPDFKHSKVFSFPSITPEHLDFFENGCITFSIYGTQEDSSGDPKYSKMSTKELREMEKISGGTSLHRRSSVHPLDGGNEVSRIKAELVTLQRRNEHLEKKEKRLQRLCDEWSKKNEEDRDFDAFFRAVSALAHSSGSRFKTSAEVISRGSQSELDELSRRGSVYYVDDSVFHNGSARQLLAAKRQLGSSNPGSPQKARITNGSRSAGGEAEKEKSGSSACVMM